MPSPFNLKTCFLPGQGLDCSGKFYFTPTLFSLCFSLPLPLLFPFPTSLPLCATLPPLGAQGSGCLPFCTAALGLGRGCQDRKHCAPARASKAKEGPPVCRGPSRRAQFPIPYFPWPLYCRRPIAFTGIIFPFKHFFSPLLAVQFLIVVVIRRYQTL